LNRKDRKFQTLRAEARQRLLSPPRRQRQKLKAERVQEELKAMPGWTLRADGKAIGCIRQFTHPAGVAEFANLVAVLAVAERQPVVVAISGNRVSVTLPPRRSAHGFTTGDLEFARQLG
jgi:pterin-4a-carbinolamine dehydratase